jgi:ABC-type oligopeptide transport system substrate-binding subunit
MKYFEDFINEGRFPEKPAAYTTEQKRALIKEFMDSVAALQEGKLEKSTLLFVEQISDDTVEITMSKEKLKFKLLKAVAS